MTEQSSQEDNLRIRPILIKSKGKKKKRRYSKGLEDIQRSGRGFTRVSSRILRSVAKGMDEFRKASDKSASKKRDGAIRDLLLNVGKASSKSLKVSARIPRDIAKAMNRRTSRRVFKRQLGLMSRANRRFGFR
jgi:hypothetical protein